MNPPARQRGIALLLVLVALVLSVTAAAGLARVAATARQRHETVTSQQHTGRLLEGSEAPILDWLHRHAGRLVLPPDAGSPRFLVLDDEIELGGDSCRLTITAFDQCGMVPSTENGGRLASFLPNGVHRALTAAGPDWLEHPGLDVLAAVAGDQVPVFPPAGTHDTGALGEHLASHNPARPGRPAVLNVNTAPLDLIVAVYAADDLGSIEAIADARAQGRPASPGASRAPRSGGGGPSIVPVSMSTAWAFRIDCRSGHVIESWWCVYTDTGSNWERVQRLAITE
ncbi:MAG: hypothetical protein HND58_04750 [Planctomycetota bacterium]|nr:MAG: hypothetical protein HND58_04750 [Planctomycetota bacterium]